jgi:protein-tyrosine-phosphatase
LPFYSPVDPAWLESLEALLRAYPFDLVIPCDDTRIIPLQQNRNSLAGVSTQIYLLDDEAYVTTADKARTYALAESLGIPVPCHREARTIDQIRAIAEQFGFPVYVKSRQSFTAEDVSTKRIVQKLRSTEELMQSDAHMIREGSVLVQQHFVGVGVGIEVLCRDGQVLVAFQHERVHEPLLGGGSSYRKSAPLNPALLKATSRLMSALRYTGVCMVEFRVNHSTGSWVLIEMNGRFWGSLPLAIAAGIDFPRYLYELLCFGRTDFPQKYRLNVFCRNWVSDAGWFRANLGAVSRQERTARATPLSSLMLELRNVVLGRERSDTFVLDDPAPARHEVRALIRKMHLMASTKRPRFGRAMRRRMLARGQRCRNILFVCKGNICRSPFAARLLSQELLGVFTVVSAGFQPSGRRSPDAAVEAALKFGVDLRDHRSAEVDEQQVRAADMIFVFDLDQAISLRRLFPESFSKTLFLGAIDDGPIEISDPYGHPVDDFSRIYSRIDAIISSVAAAVRSGLWESRTPDLRPAALT